MMNMDILFLGMNDIGQEIYDWLCDRDSIFVKAIITEPEQLRLVEEMCPDAVVASGFTHIVPPEILEIPPEGCINLHPGYLPHTRGYFPNIWSIVDDLPPGATLHYMDENIDTGEIIARSKVQKSFEDDGKTVYRRIEDKAVELFKQEWYKIEQGQVETISNDDEIANSYYNRDFDELREINPYDTYQAKELIDILRALTFPEYNNAYIEIGNNRYYIEVDIQK
jgi:methionyl-tRNA formyltransferase